jgi:hypothetical protein
MAGGLGLAVSFLRINPTAIMLSDQQAIRAGIGAMKSDLVPADDVKIHIAGGHPSIKGAIDSTEAGASNKIRINTPVAHGLTTGWKVAVQLGPNPRPHGSGFGTEYAVTVIGATVFDLDGSAYNTAVPSAGKWELVEDLTTPQKWYPGVDHWALVQARGGDVVFDASGCALADVPTGVVRPGDGPFEDETIPDGQQWLEGPLSSFQMKTGGGAARLVRGG